MRLEDSFLEAEGLVGLSWIRFLSVWLVELRVLRSLRGVGLTRV